MRLRYIVTDRHRKAVSQELLQRMSAFHKEVVERKETAKDVLEKAFLVACLLSGKGAHCKQKVSKLD